MVACMSAMSSRVIIESATRLSSQMSSGTRILSTSALSTMRAASGSAQMLYSDSGVMLPGVTKVPPSTSMRFSAPASLGSCRNAIAALVVGPVVTSVISPGLSSTVFRMTSTAWPAWLTASASGPAG